MTEPTALEALRALGEQASARPWTHGYRRQGHDVWSEAPEDLLFVNSQCQPANSAYAAVAVNSIDAAVAALENTAFWYHALAASGGEHPTAEFERCSSVVCNENRATLAAIRKAALEAQT